MLRLKLFRYLFCHCPDDPGWEGLEKVELARRPAFVPQSKLGLLIAAFGIKSTDETNVGVACIFLYLEYFDLVAAF